MLGELGMCRNWQAILGVLVLASILDTLVKLTNCFVNHLYTITSWFREVLFCYLIMFVSLNWISWLRFVCQ